MPPLPDQIQQRPGHPQVASNNDVPLGARVAKSFRGTAELDEEKILNLGLVPPNVRDERRGQSYRSSTASYEANRRYSNSYATRRERPRPLDPLVMRRAG